MGDLEKIINSPEQKSGEFWQRASDIITDHTELLKTRFSADGEERYLLTPSFVPARGAEFENPASTYSKFRVGPMTTEDARVKRILSQSYSIAAHVNRKGPYKPDMPLYLIINDNVSRPLLKFERTFSRLMILDGSYGELENSDELISAILRFIDQGMDACQASHDAREHRQRFRKRVAAGIIAPLLAGASGIGYWRWDAANDIRETRQRFDAQDIDIKAPGVTSGLSFVESDPAFFAQHRIPGRTERDSFAHPRHIKVGEGSCKGVVTLVPGQEEVRVVTSAPREQVYVAVNSEGVTQVCSFETTNDTSETSEVSYDAALQVVPKAPR